MKRALSVVIAVVFAFMFVVGSNALADEKMRIVCTSFPCYDFCRAVAGDLAEIDLLIKPGAEVHSFEPTPADILNIAGCDLFVYIGGPSDAWVEDILDSLDGDAPKTLRLIECVEAEHAEHHHEAGHEHDAEAAFDEHIWTSPKNAVHMVDYICAELCALNSGDSAGFEAQSGAYIDEIQKIDAAFTEIVENAQRREMIFADRFPFLYFARAYDIEWYSAFDSCSSESEPSAKTMMGLIDRVICDDIPVIYTIELSSGKTAQTISAETGAEICVFHSVQNVSEADFAAGETYVSLMTRNIEALERGLN